MDFYIPIKSAEYYLSYGMLNLNPYCAFQTLQAAKQHKFSANVTLTSNCHPCLVFSFPQLLNRPVARGGQGGQLTPP